MKNDNQRDAIRAIASNVQEMMKNITSLATNSPDAVTVSAWSHTLVKLERLYSAAMGIVDYIATAGAPDVEERSRKREK